MSQIEENIYAAFLGNIKASETLPTTLVSALEEKMSASSPALKADELVALITEHVNPEQL